MNMLNPPAVELDESKPSAHQLADQINADLGFRAVEVGSRLESFDLPTIANRSKPKGGRRTREALDRLELELIPLDEAERQVGLSRTAFWRFRKRHRIRVLPGRRVNVDDIIDAFRAERGGKRRQVA